MKVHEHQAKEVLARFGVPVPLGHVATTVDEAIDGAASLGGDLWVVKAQIHAGGRGKGGGVEVCRSLKDVRRAAGRILGMNLVTKQTGAEGQKVRKILVETGCAIDREFYAAAVIDREQACPILMTSAAGGMDIEEVAAESPEKIRKTPFADDGLALSEGREVAQWLGLSGGLLDQGAEFLCSLSKAIIATDASLAEVNPFVTTADGRVLALDAKLSIDDNALFRQEDLARYRDPHEEDAREVRAAEFGLSYIKLDGTIGCMVNGAGLAMATLDIIQHFGGEPANFLDVGGGATAAQVREAFHIILEDSGVRAVLVNIFGGIMRCDVIAKGILDALQSSRDGTGGKAKLKVPLVVRLEGTNVEEGMQLLRDSDLEISVAKGLADAAKQAVAAASGERAA